MKKIFLTLLAFIFFSSLCFAQQATTPVKILPKTAVEIKNLTGKVEAVTVADQEKGIKSEIVVVDDNANKTTFLVKSTTTIYDADWKAINLNKIKKDDKVKVKYSVTKEGVNEAVSVNLIKQ